jgi:hypothetical protein
LGELGELFPPPTIIVRRRNAGEGIEKPPLAFQANAPVEPLSGCPRRVAGVGRKQLNFLETSTATEAGTVTEAKHASQTNCVDCISFS